MELFAIIRILVFLVAGSVFFVFFRNLARLPIRGHALWGTGFCLVLLHQLVGALFHGELLPDTLQERWMPMIGSFTGYIGLPIGIFLILFGTYRLVRSLESYLDTRYYNLIEHSLVGVYLLQDGVFKFVNMRAAEQAGYDRDELVGKPFMNFIAPHSREVVQENIRKRLAGEADEVRYECTFIKKDGQLIEVEVNGSQTVYNDKPAIQGTLIDITARKLAEKSLKARERQQAAVAKLGQRALSTVDIDILMNEAVAAVAETLEVEYCKVLELLPGDKFLLRAGVGWKPGSVGNATVGAGADSQAGYTLNSDGPVIVQDLRTETRFHGPALLIEHNVISGISVVIQGQPQHFGVLGAHTTIKRAFTDDDVHFLQTVANVVAVAMERKQADQEIRFSNKLLGAISHAQSQFIADLEPKAVLDEMLQDLVSLTESEFGFIGDVLYGADDTPYLKIRVVSNIARSGKYQRFYEAYAPAGLEFKNLKNLLGEVMTSGKPIIANDPAHNPRRGGVPEGHPPLRAFLGLPFFHGDRLIGMVGIANRPGGYDEKLVQELQPFVLTCANIIDALKNHEQRVQAEQALRESEDRYRDLVENSNDLICTHDLQGRLLSINQCAARALGYDQSDLVNRNIREFIPPVYRNGVDAYLEKLKKTGYAKGLMRVRTAEGEVRIWEYHDTLRIEGVAEPIVRGLAHDITERKRMENDLRESEKRFRDMADTVPAMIWITGPDKLCTYFNKCGLEFTGKRLEQELASAWTDDLHPDDVHRCVDLYETAFDTRMPFKMEYRLRRWDGEYRWVIDEGVPRYTSRGDFAGYIGSCIDLTERRQSEEELRRLAHALRSITESICICDLNDNIMFVNDSFVKTYGYERGELIGKSIEMIRAPANPPTTVQQIRPGTIMGGWQGELINRKKDGAEFPVFLSTSVVEDENKRPIAFVGVASDLTDRKHAEQALLQAQKLESLGVLAGGIAHDFNNLLVGILGNAGLALMEVAPESPARQTVEEIQLAGQRAAELVKQMLAYSGKGHFVVQPLNLNALVEEMGHLLRASIGKNVFIKFDYANQLPAIEADATQIRQIVMNLVINASEAIGNENGVINISTGVLLADRTFLSECYPNNSLPEGDYVYLKVVDTGCGMDAETKAKIFDPFFTTKFTGRGLGLAATLGIVRGHNGAIKITSATGQGTTFKVLLPATHAATPLDSNDHKHLRSISGNGNKVLVIDDDPTVRKVTARVLKRLGFEVIEADGGKNGIKIFSEHAEEIICVLLDLTMPHPNGEEVFREIHGLRQATPVILMSGYDEQDATSQFAGKGIAGFLKKPYSPDELYRHLEKIMNNG